MSNTHQPPVVEVEEEEGEEEEHQQLMAGKYHPPTQPEGEIPSRAVSAGVAVIDAHGNNSLTYSKNVCFVCAVLCVFCFFCFCFVLENQKQKLRESKEMEK